MCITKQFEIRDRTLTIRVRRNQTGAPGTTLVTLETDDNRNWTGTYPATPGLVHIEQGIQKLEREGPMIQYRVKDLSAIRQWVSQVSQTSGPGTPGTR